MTAPRGAPAGLSSADALLRLQRDGPNAMPEPERRSAVAIAAKVLREPMLLLLLAATGVYVVLGEPGEALLLALSVLLVIGLTLYQEQKAEHALQALREIGSPRARVLREGLPALVDTREVVVGDVLLIAEGDRLAADARVVEESDLHLDESMLTGESIPVRRETGATAHAGTLAVRGHAMAEVIATGSRTAMGRIGVALQTLRAEPTPMQRQMRRVVLLFAGLSLLSCVAMTVLYGLMRGQWLQALLAGLTLAIANIPEEFPVVLTVFLALGAWRMAQHAALVRRAPSIEAMGAITVLCTDKTGTLTENCMQVAELRAGEEHATALPVTRPALQAVLRTAAMASPRLSHDPMERALHEAMAAGGVQAEAAEWQRDYPFSPALPVVAIAWRHADGRHEIACKGAPETIASLCRLSPHARAACLADVDAMAARGLRVLAVAAAHPQAPGDALDDHAFQWLGLVAFADPLRAGVAGAVAEAHAAGVRVLMLTGDHAVTARAIAREAGIASGDDVVVAGVQLETLSDDAMREAVRSASVYARVKPEHKLRMVQALKAHGDVVAMTGDGVNDAPALMAAHVGIAMGRRGTDVAREAASIVLLDDNFVTVVRAIRLGRTIYENILRAVRYILAVHVPITGLALLPLFTGSPLVLLPLHVVFLELIIDPACSIVLEREPAADDLMRRPPRPAAQPLLTLNTMLTSLAQGALIFGAVVVVHGLGAAAGLPATQNGALAFTALVGGNLGLLLLYREGATPWRVLRQRNVAFWWVVLGALGALALSTRWPVAAAWLGFSPPPLGRWLLALALPVSVTVVMKLLTARAPRLRVTGG